MVEWSISCDKSMFTFLMFGDNLIHRLIFSPFILERSSCYIDSGLDHFTQYNDEIFVEWSISWGKSMFTFLKSGDNLFHIFLFDFGLTSITVQLWYKVKLIIFYFLFFCLLLNSFTSSMLMSFACALRCRLFETIFLINIPQKPQNVL